MGPNTVNTNNLSTMVADFTTHNDDDAAEEILEPLKDESRPLSSMSRNLSRDSLVKLAENEEALQHCAVQVTTQNQLRPMHCAAQEYAWGRVGRSSTVARMKAAQCSNNNNDDEFCIDESTPYAELWLGTHPSGMSSVTSSTNDNEKVSLLDYVRQDPEQHCGRSEWTDLTFLLKVLSIEKVLSIQAHPDKKLAEKLHAERPHIYKDPNHKPEMAICISDTMQAMCGFRPIGEIAANIQLYPEFAAILGDEVAQQVQRMVHSPATRAVLQRMFQTYLECDERIVGEQLNSLLNRLKQNNDLSPLDTLMLDLSEQFPNDSGIIAPLMFNVVTLKKGDGLYIGANEPHAYINGELVECMACSDNVVRAGLTPKLKDVPTLVDMLTYKSCVPEFHTGIVIDACTRRYQPPVPDFCVDMITVEAGETYEVGGLTSPSVLLCLEGNATLQQSDVCSMQVSFGHAAFCSSKTRTTIVAGSEGVQLVRAFTNIYHDAYKYEGLQF